MLLHYLVRAAYWQGLHPLVVLKSFFYIFNIFREQSRMNDRMPIVGKYSVNVSDFENLIVPLLCPKSKKDLLIIDEIGTMELKSKRFQKALNDVIHKTPIFATIPCHSHRKNNILEHIKSSPATRIFEITKNNRNIVQNDIVNCIKNMLRKN
ncbi:unnamed protein product [Ceratitis capitata]|uniref:(Mediterranean fruit fly) hypothetical protein n=1 Tax=Ceratitis capitata TaxID=7213 RepID=A0A811V040_CERCA|nr:unnamed protein product [Ceratitis capitata]